MIEIKYTSRFKKDLRKIKSQGKNLRKLEIIIKKIVNMEPLDIKHQDHQLVGNYVGFRECHIEPDWLLIYKIENGTLVLVLHRTGSHADLFD